MTDYGANTPKKVRRSPALVCGLMALSVLAAALTLASGFMVIGAALITFGAALFSLLVLMRAPAAYIAVCPVSVALGCVVAALAGGGIPTYIMLVAFVALGGVLALCVSKKYAKTATVVALAACFGAAVIAVLIYLYLSGRNEFSPDAIKAYIDAKTDELLALSENITREELIPMLGKFSVDADALVALVRAAVLSTVYMTPGLFIAAMQILGYLCCSWFLLFVKIESCDVIMPAPVWELYPTTVTAVIYIISYVVYLFASLGSSVSVAEIIALNVSVTVAPPMLAVGMVMIFSGGRRRRRVNMLPVGILALLFIIQPVMAAVLLSMLGAFSVIARRRLEAKLSKNDDEKNNDGKNDSDKYF